MSGSARLNLDNTIAVRCWDGMDMEFEEFLLKDFFNYLDKGYDNNEIAARIGAVCDVHFTRLMEVIRIAYETDKDI